MGNKNSRNQAYVHQAQVPTISALKPMSLSDTTDSETVNAKESSVTTENNKLFKVKHNEVRNAFGKVITVWKEIHFKDVNLASAVQGYGVMMEWEDHYFSRTGKCRVADLMLNVERFRKNIAANGSYMAAEFKKLLDWMEDEHKASKKEADAMITQGEITFDLLWTLIHMDSEVFASTVGNQLVGTRVKQVSFSRGLIDAFYVSGQVIKSNGEEFFTIESTFRIGEFNGTKPITALSVQPMNDVVRNSLVQRGKTFRKISIGHHYRQYSGFQFFAKNWGHTSWASTGRVMVDLKSFMRLNPGYQAFVNPNAAANNMQYNSQALQMASMGLQQNDEQQKNTTLRDENLFMTWPSVAGFSLSQKQWGELLVCNITPVQFDEHAYDRLVMDVDKKELIRALVDQHHRQNRQMASELEAAGLTALLTNNGIAPEDAKEMTAKKRRKHSKQKSSKKKGKQPVVDDKVDTEGAGFSDLIAGKGAGRVFLLHGPPGVGKTLTAEAISEHLHRPLYSVTIGELGTGPKELEKSLQEILDVAGVWDAVVLMDEADIFLEQRTEHEIVRNAMVGIFLRLLEYHQGVLFLTTNRVKCFDHAFHSRINVALQYEELDQPSRNQVWSNLLCAAGIDPTTLDLVPLAKHKINGRQIRSTIQLATALASAQNTPVDMRLLNKTLGLTEDFNSVLHGQDSPSPLAPPYRSKPLKPLDSGSEHNGSSSSESETDSEFEETRRQQQHQQQDLVNFADRPSSSDSESDSFSQ